MSGAGLKINKRTLHKMCGIWALLNSICTDSDALERLETLRARGPEGTRTFALSTLPVRLGFTRLAINGLNEEGMQPMSFTMTTELQKGMTMEPIEQGSDSDFEDDSESVVGNCYHWICNGELYNWRALASKYNIPVNSGSDCEILGALWSAVHKDIFKFFTSLDGVFAIVLIDEARGEAIVGRDPFGVRPLFYGKGADGGVMFASEMKALKGCSSIKAFPPGCCATIPLRSEEPSEIYPSCYFAVPSKKNPHLSSSAGGNGLLLAQQALRESLTAAVKKRLMTERPVAALLSGGIDSSLIAAIVQRELKALGKPPLETFSIGFEGSPDLFFARKVAEHIGSNHTEIVVTPDDFFGAIPEVIRAIESYDITTVRASVGNWMVSREIARRSQAKVVFNGDGSDEVFGSYLYFFRAPTDEAFEAESGRLLQDIHLYDVLRSDRSISCHGLEARTPFLDKQFVAVARSIATVWRRPVRGEKPDALETGVSSTNQSSATHRPEKWILRTAFEPEGLLPPEVLWRQKEAFSDGVSGQQKSWYQEVQERVGSSSTTVEEAAARWPHLTPRTPEAIYYRALFDEAYGPSCESVFPYFWMPKWSGETQDPSARTLSLY